MGLLVSKVSADSAPPPLPTFTNIGQAAAAALKADKPDYLALPAPVKYEEIQREVLMALKPDVFEGMRFEINKPLNPNFFLSHSLFMGNMDLSTGGRQTLKTPMGNYEFGANVINERFMMLGRITTDGRCALGGGVGARTQWLSILGGVPPRSQPAGAAAGTRSGPALRPALPVTPGASAGALVQWRSILPERGTPMPHSQPAGLSFPTRLHPAR